MIRQIKKDSFFMSVKISGLAIGMAASILMLLYLYQQTHFDNFHEDKENIYQLIIEMNREGIYEKIAVGTAEMGISLLEEFPEIIDMTRFSMHEEVYFQVDDNIKILKDFQYADSSIFSMFSFRILQGNPQTALQKPFSLVLTQSGAVQLFGKKNPMGRVIRMNGQHDYMVTGIMEDPPTNSHLQFMALGSFSTLYQLDGYYMDWDGGWGYYTYIKTIKDADMKNIMTKLPAFLEKHINYKYRNYGAEIRFRFDPLTKIYLHSSAPEHMYITGNIVNLYIFGAVAIFILIIASINFMNLATARYSNRIKEAGIRKVLGASRKQLIVHFLGEALFISGVAMVFTLLLVELLLPEFSSLFNTQIKISNVNFLLFVSGLLLLWLVVGLFSGSYPAFFITALNPVQTIKGNYFSVNKGKLFRNVLVTGQFLISSALIISTIGVYKQINYLKTKSLGFDKENILVLQLDGEKSQQAAGTLKLHLKQLPFVISAGASTDIPVWGLTSNGYIPEGMKNSIIINTLDVDDEWLQTMNIRLVAGRNFDRTRAEDQENFIINQALAKKMGWDDPIGKIFYRDGKHTVIGVVSDFHFTPLHNPIQPLILTSKPFDNFSYLSLRLNTYDYQKALAVIEKTWMEVVPGEPFIYHFLDQLLLKNYDQEKRFGRGFVWFSSLAVFLACLGLFALASYLTNQRRKEIGIRKTFGASAWLIVWLLAKDFLRLVIIGNVLAMVLAWIFLEKWLENFAFRITQNVYPYLFTLLLTIMIALLTVVWQSVKAARQNPVDAIRYE